ncbi:MAG: glycosyltransferase, partial [Bdellovibrionales bacterium]|nr:glycosyltransferase [Bdellovibrionales bacterium]
NRQILRGAMRVALVHDWITGMRGGERCLDVFVKLYPNADIFTLIHIPGTTNSAIDSRVVQTSFLQKIPGIRKFYRYFLPLYPLAIRGFDFSEYDLVISLSHAAAKNISVPRGVKHICYCFTPMRYIWDQADSYFGKAVLVLWPIIRLLREWDVRASQRVDKFVAISKFVAGRIRKYYARNSRVIYPPVDNTWITPIADYFPGEAFLYAGALVPYKNVDSVVRAFNKLGEKLWIVGEGPEKERLQKMADKNIEFVGFVPDAELAKYYYRCRALIFPAKEDFGIIPIECLAAGRPVIGLYAGALRESLKGARHWVRGNLNIRQKSGVFFPQRSSIVQGIIGAVNFFREHEASFNPKVCVANAKQFSKQVFVSSWNAFLEDPESEILLRESAIG